MPRWIGVLLLLVVFAPFAAAAQPAPGPAPAPVAPPDENDRSAAGPPRPADVALTRSGRPEFVATLPTAQAEAALAALAQAGARLLRFRDLPRFALRVAVLDLGRLGPDRARAVLASVAPGAGLDPNALYRLAQGTAAPRLYAPALIGEAPARCRLGAALRVGMIDGPVDGTHPALQGARIVQQSALLPGQRPAHPDHGTAVAGLIVGVDGGGTFTGFATGATLYAATAFARERRGGGVAAAVERIAAALDWMLAAGVRVINMSFAGPENAVLADLLAQTHDRGVVLIAAAGNDGRDTVAFPAAAPAVIAVTAVDAALRPYRHANRGTQIDVAAPGVDLYVAESDGGGYASGTSYAAPIVAALAARHLARGARDGAAVRAALRGSARPLGEGPGDPRFGWGLVRAPGC
jgi:subtilisin family serine protease